jgi:hypothetical protein
MAETAIKIAIAPGRDNPNEGETDAVIDVAIDSEIGVAIGVAVDKADKAGDKMKGRMRERKKWRIIFDFMPIYSKSQDQKFWTLPRGHVTLEP